MKNKNKSCNVIITTLLFISLFILTSCGGNKVEDAVESTIEASTGEKVEESRQNNIEENYWKDIKNEHSVLQKKIDIQMVSHNSLLSWDFMGEDGEALKNSGKYIEELFSTKKGNNIWVFTGGEAVAPGFDDLGSRRNYISHFEEFIRWELASDESVGETAIKNARQRYTINVGKKGMMLKDIIRDWDHLITKNHPKAIVHFLGQEDYGKGKEGVDEFCKALKSFLNLGLTEGDGDCVIVLQLPFCTGITEMDNKIELYMAGVSKVLNDVENGYITDSEKYERILVVNHYDASKNQWMDNKLENDERRAMEEDLTFEGAEITEGWVTKDGNLTAEGHFEISFQLAEAVFSHVMKQSSYFPSKREDTLFKSNIIKNIWEPAEVNYEVKYEDEKLIVSLNGEVAGESQEEYYYEVKVLSANKNEITLKNYVMPQTDNTFIIEGIEPDSHWLLQLETGDRKVRFPSMEGVAMEGEKAVRHQPKAFTKEATDQQKKIADLLNNNDSLRWLFVGDSITHGNLATHGQDNMVQLFEKYVRQELDRPDDIVINSAIWASTIEDYINGDYADVRLDWDADVVMVMLGTNDAGISATREESVFKENFYQLLKKTREYNPNAIVVIRTPIYTEEEYRVTNLLPVLDWMKEISSMREEGGMLADIYIDQYTPSTQLLQGYPWLYGEGKGGDLIYFDDLHPNELGHLLMFRQLLEELGLYNIDSPMLNFYYDKISYQEVRVDADLGKYIIPKQDNSNIYSMIFDVSSFVTDYPEVGNLTFRVVDSSNGQRREGKAIRKVVIGENFEKVDVLWEADKIIEIGQLHSTKEYEIEVIGMSESENKIINFY